MFGLNDSLCGVECDEKKIGTPAAGPRRLLLQVFSLKPGAMGIEGNHDSILE